MGQNLGQPDVHEMGSAEKSCEKQKKSPLSSWKAAILWLREEDSNLRPPGYEPDELPTALSRDIGAGDRGRTGTGLLPRDFKSRASANSATPAQGGTGLV